RGIRLNFEDSNPEARFQGERKSAAPNNYFSSTGSHSEDAFLRLRQKEVYPGIDVVYYGEGEGLEYDLELAPGADPATIRMRFGGADLVSLNGRGELVLTLNGKEVTQKPPVVYQRRASGEVVGVESSYFVEDDGSVRLGLGNYDRTAALVIDPQVLFSLYLAGSGSDVPIGIAHDKNNTIYVAGRTYSPDFPFAGVPYSTQYPVVPITLVPSVVFVSVLNPLLSGDAVLPYSGFLTGMFGSDLNAMSVDDNGIVYLAGTTGDGNFPLTANAIETSAGGNNAKVFIAALNTTIQGTAGLVYSTFFAGSQIDLANGIVSANGKIYVTGVTTSDDFPLANAFQSTRAGGIYDAWVSVIDPNRAGSAGLIFSSYLGGSGEDIARSIAVDPAGQIWVAGETYSNDLFASFPPAAGSLQPSYSGGGDAFLARIDPVSYAVTYSTYLGGSGQEQAKKILLDAQGRVAVTGYTLSDECLSALPGCVP
ncbi:MAG: SBBP repeat-containing protein, partial [Bryobacteraceae bacterium]